MKKLFIVTGNPVKFAIAKTILEQFDIEAVQKILEIDEIQGTDPVHVIRDKAKKAFDLVDQPIAVTDDWWDFPALGGFPGAYMKDINFWFEPDDLVRLIEGKADRRVLLHAHVAYYDGQDFQYFTNSYSGTVAEKPRGNYGPPIMKVSELPHDGSKTISEIYDMGSGGDRRRHSDPNDAWAQLGRQLTKKAKK